MRTTATNLPIQGMEHTGFCLVVYQASPSFCQTSEESLLFKVCSGIHPRYILLTRCESAPHKAAGARPFQARRTRRSGKTTTTSLRRAGPSPLSLPGGMRGMRPIQGPSGEIAALRCPLRDRGGGGSGSRSTSCRRLLAPAPPPPGLPFFPLLWRVSSPPTRLGRTLAAAPPPLAVAFAQAPRLQALLPSPSSSVSLNWASPASPRGASLLRLANTVL